MRLFVGIDIPIEIKEKIDVLVYDLAKQIKSPVKWVEKNNFHVNLKFLDEVNENNIIEINSIIKQEIGIINPQSLIINIQDILVFPNINQPRVIGLKVVLADDLTKLALKLNKNLEQLPYIKKEFKPFRPHLTLGRVKFTLTEVEKGIVGNIKFNDKFEAKKICLFESQLGPQGPVYKIIEKFTI